MKIGNKLAVKFDFYIFGCVLVLIGFGLAAIYSSTLTNSFAAGNFQKQLISFFVALSALYVFYLIPYSFYKSLSIPIYVFSIALLILVLLIGKTIGGAKSWIALGPFSFQPAEFAKLATLISLAAFLARESTNIESVKDVVIALLIGLVPVALILKEPDLGSSFIFMGMILTLLFWKGITPFGLFLVLSPAIVMVSALFGWYAAAATLLLVVVLLFLFKKKLVISAIVFTINLASAFFVNYLFKFLSPHQKKRVESFIDPNSDPLGSGYNALQAQIAIGSGGFTGKGFLQGNQTQLQFIPEQWTDFIFCTVGEEFGFIGSFIVVLCYTVLLYRILKLAYEVKNEFLSLMLAGIFSIYFFHFTVNIGMAIGVMPVIGIPLPFVSYGGSSLLMNMTMLGIVLNIYKTKNAY
ncbi:MAG: rod shape-determining protein RodA [Ignavibacteriaceae bacterium]|nr:rod shape-determining protein RodA [Ignavibacteriaceae bacterium]